MSTNWDDKARELVEAFIDSLKDKDTWLTAMVDHRQRIATALREAAGVVTLITPSWPDDPTKDGS